MKRSKHVGKSQQQRQQYSHAIKNLDYEPTVKERLDFNQSDEMGIDLSLATSTKRRMPAVSERISKHFHDNWITWMFLGIGSIIMFFGFTFNRDLGQIQGVISELKPALLSVRNECKELVDKLHKQEIKVEKNAYRIEQLENNANADKHE